MSKLTESIFTVKGASGTKYEFNIYSLDTNFKAIGGIYIFTQRSNSNQQFERNLVYCGKTNDLSNRFESHHKEDCIRQNGANCICVMLVSSEQERRAIEADILSGNDFKCNEILN
jgi:hypothetical protein